MTLAAAEGMNSWCRILGGFAPRCKRTGILSKYCSINIFLQLLRFIANKTLSFPHA
jgi:hypothetical protein